MNNSTTLATTSRGVPGKSPFFSEEPNYDENMLTPVLKGIMSELTKCSDAPEAFFLPSILAYWAGVIGNKVALDDLRPNIWTAVFAGSSIMRKSTAIKLTGTPYRNIQQTLENGQKIILPSDFSDAGFFEMMQNNALAGTIVATEFSDFHKKLNRDYTGMGEAFLSAYDNDSMVHVTRSFGEEVVNEPSFSILGATTLVGFKKVFSGSELENGFLQRFMPVVVPNNTKDRILYMQRKAQSKNSIYQMENKIKMWLEIDRVDLYFDDALIIMHGSWEESIIDNAKAQYGDAILTFIERHIVNCIKLTMLISCLEEEKVENDGTINISTQSLRCSMHLLQHLFIPSLVHLLENEIVYDLSVKRERKLLNIIGNNRGIPRTALRNMISSSYRKFMNEDLERLVKTGKILKSYSQGVRVQGGGTTEYYYELIK